jgi:hypothetical protein
MFRSHLRRYRNRFQKRGRDRKNIAETLDYVERFVLSSFNRRRQVLVNELALAR